MHRTNLLPANRFRMLERKPKNPLASILGDQLNALDNTFDDDVLDAGVLSLGIFTDQDGVDVVVGGLVAGNRPTRTNVGEEVEGTAESQVEGDVALTDGCLNRVEVNFPCCLRQTGDKQQEDP